MKLFILINSDLRSNFYIETTLLLRQCGLKKHVMRFILELLNMRVLVCIDEKQKFFLYLVY